MLLRVQALGSLQRRTSARTAAPLPASAASARPRPPRGPRERLGKLEGAPKRLRRRRAWWRCVPSAEHCLFSCAQCDEVSLHILLVPHAVRMLHFPGIKPGDSPQVRTHSYVPLDAQTGFALQTHHLLGQQRESVTEHVAGLRAAGGDRSAWSGGARWCHPGRAVL